MSLADKMVSAQRGGSSEQRQLVGFIKRYNALRRFRYEPVHQQQLEALHQWQQAQMRERHRDLMSRAQLKHLLDFFLSEIYLGLDLSEIREHSDEAVLTILKLFHGTDMLNAALEFNALTGEIDQRLTEALFDDCAPATPITETAYAQACAEQNLFGAMTRQKMLVNAFADGLNSTLRNRLILQAIKWAGVPARAIGFGNLHRIVLQGFAVLQPLRDVEDVIAMLVQRELDYVNHLRQLAETGAAHDC